MSVVVKLQDEEMDVLMQYSPDPETTDSSLQGLLDKLRSQIDAEQNQLSLSEEDLQSIQSYVSQNGNEDEGNTLVQLFGRISELNVQQ